MKPYLLSLLAVLSAPSFLCAADPTMVNEATVQQAMQKATQFMTSISTHGGYVYKYSPDLSQRFGEQPASATQIWIQPPGTSSMGMTFLRAYNVTKAPLYLDAAHSAALSLVQVQLPSGGWHYSGNFDPKFPNRDGILSYQGAMGAHANDPDNPHHFVATTFDDDNTQSAIRFLMAYVETAKGSKEPDFDQIQKSVDTALAGMIRAQYPNGAWPQRYSGRPRDPKDYPILHANIPATYPKKWPGIDYTAFYTTNDNCQRDCIFVMFDAYHRYGKPEYLASATRGADFFLLAQLPEPQPVWAQQYNFQMQPCWARIFEPPGAVSSESRSAISALLEIYLETGAKKYLDAIAPAVAWYKRSALAPDTWSRLYEMGTNKPIYGNKDGLVHYKLDEAKPGYTWQSAFKIPPTLADYEEVKSMGREAYLKAHPEPMNEIFDKKNPHDLVKNVRQDLKKMDDQGRMITVEPGRKFAAPKPYISTEVYIGAMNDFCNYLKAPASPATEKSP